MQSAFAAAARGYSALHGCEHQEVLYGSSTLLACFGFMMQLISTTLVPEGPK